MENIQKQGLYKNPKTVCCTVDKDGNIRTRINREQLHIKKFRLVEEI